MDATIVVICEDMILGHTKKVRNIHLFDTLIWSNIDFPFLWRNHHYCPFSIFFKYALLRTKFIHLHPLSRSILTYSAKKNREVYHGYTSTFLSEMNIDVFR